MITCEVCVEGFSGAAAAEAGGGHRIELCAGLIEGGTTPSLGTLSLVRERLSIKTVVLLRPRGGDFLYTDEEFDTMLRDIEVVRNAGAYGVATGVLTEDGRIDAARFERLTAAARPLSVTCHRAFDMTRDPKEALETLIELGVDRVLTSGQQPSVPEGIELIRELVDLAAERIVIMPGCGIEEGNVREIVEATGVCEVHFTAFSQQDSGMTYRNSRPFMGGVELPGEYDLQFTDPERVSGFLREVAGIA
jgi:copper homeostasis protein